MSLDAHLFLALLEGTVGAMVLALTALGLSLIFGVMRIVNVAHGEFFMLGAVVTWYGFAPSCVHWRRIGWAAGILASPWVAVFFLSAALNMSPVRVVVDMDMFHRPEPVISGVAIAMFCLTVAGRQLFLRPESRRTE